MKLIAISVGQPKDVPDERRGLVRTSIWKVPIDGPVHVGRTNIEGDAQADLEVHGGVDKAVYAYPAEHYAPWRSELNRPRLMPGGFGENLTIQGLLEETVYIGDRLRIGTALFEVSQPRSPCYKLGVRFGDPMVIKKFTASGRSGYYLRVVKEGRIKVGDVVKLTHRAHDSLTVAEVNRLLHHERNDRRGFARAAALPELAEEVRSVFAERAAKLENVSF